MMRKFWFKLLFSSLWIVAFSFPCFAGWIVFSKPEFKGKVIDTETKQPIEGAIVVAIYKTGPIISGPAGGSTTIIHIKEVLTDERGEFLIPEYTTLMGPNTVERNTDFIIYKPGYGSGTGLHSSPSPHVRRELLFSKTMGDRGEIQLRGKTVSFTYGIVELPRLNTWEERRKASMKSISDVPKNKWPLLHTAIEKEDEWLNYNKGWRR